MNLEHWQLLISWIIYCIIHSVLAEAAVKNYIKRIMGKSFKYYRISYSIFAFVTLALLLWFQFSIKSEWLLSRALYTFLPGIMVSLIGVTIMVVCINKYFFEMSGLQAIQNSQAKYTLQQSGLHKYVRHPLYLGTILFITGLFFIFPLMSNLISMLVVTTYVLLGIKLEEKKLRSQFGKRYIDYAKKVPMLVPKLK